MTQVETDDAGPGTGLRERRRLQTEREICEIALDLFEAQGVERTTADEIARRAGISPRTFFRYFAAKEQAALVGDPVLEQRVNELIGRLDGDQPLLPQLEGIWREILLALDDGRSAAGRQLLRVRRLMQHEPVLRLAGIRLDEERCTALVARVCELLGTRGDAAAEAEVRMAVEIGDTVVRGTLDRWADAAECGERVGLVATYEQACATLRAVTRCLG